MDEGNISFPTVLAKTFDTVKAATGIDLAEIVRSESYGAKVNRNLTISGSLDGLAGTAQKPEKEPEAEAKPEPETDPGENTGAETGEPAVS